MITITLTFERTTKRYWVYTDPTETFLAAPLYLAKATTDAPLPPSEITINVPSDTEEAKS